MTSSARRAPGWGGGGGHRGREHQPGPLGRRAVRLMLVWGILGPPDERRPGVTEATVPLEELVTKAARYDGKTVTVLGQFRARTSSGTCPPRAGGARRTGC